MTIRIKSRFVAPFKNPPRLGRDVLCSGRRALGIDHRQDSLFKRPRRHFDALQAKALDSGVCALVHACILPGLGTEKASIHGRPGCTTSNNENEGKESTRTGQSKTTPAKGTLPKRKMDQTTNHCSSRSPPILGGNSYLANPQIQPDQ